MSPTPPARIPTSNATHDTPTVVERTSGRRTRRSLTSLSPRAARIEVALALTICGLCASAVGADIVLQSHNPSSTAYKYASATSVQKIRPLAIQRGVGVDGSRRGGGLFGAALAGNPFGSPQGGTRVLAGQVNLVTGTYAPTDIDLALPAEVSWPIGRTFNGRQETSGGSIFDSDGSQGVNWMQISQPEIGFYDDAVSVADDLVYIVYGADRYIELKRDGALSTEFAGINGSAGTMQYNSGSPDTWDYYDQKGKHYTFFGGNTSGNKADWQLWKIVDADGNTAYVGHATTATTAVTNGYNADGTIAAAFDSSDHRYTYSYDTTINSIDRLTEVLVEIDDGDETWETAGTETEVAKVQYAYYTADGDDHGDAGDLKKVTVTIPQTDSGVNYIREKGYWYWDGEFNASTNPGHSGLVKFAFHYEGWRRGDYDGDSNFDDDLLTASETSAKAYAAAYYEYEDRDEGNGLYGRITEAWFNGECGCSGAPNGTYTLTYEDNDDYTDTSGYTTGWATRTMIDGPDNWTTAYYDEMGQPLSTVITDSDPSGSPTKIWSTKVTRDSNGLVTEICTPANVTGYTHNEVDPPDPDGSFTTSTTVGLVRTYEYETTGDLTGLLEHSKFSTGTSGDDDLESTIEYTSASKTIGDVTMVRPLIEHRWVYTEQATTEAEYGVTTPSGAYSTDMAYTMYTGDAALMPKKIVTTNPVVTTAKNGSNSATTATRYLREDGSTAFSESADGIFSYTQYTDGRAVKRISDAQTNHATDFAAGDDPNTTWSISETSSGERWITSYTYDNQGRIDEVTAPSGDVSKKYYSVLLDRRRVAINIPRYTSGTPTFYGPVGYSVSNHAGKAEASASIYFSGGSTTTALTGWITEGSANVVGAVATGTVTRLSTSVYNETGQTLEESRSYFDVPSSTPGTEGTHYDSTTYAYDDAGRTIRTAGPTGDRSRTSYDLRGRTTQKSRGTNDNGETGGDSSGTNTMIITVKYEYDETNDEGNSLLTKQTIDADGNWGVTTDQRVTTYEYDVRGRRIVTNSALSPHQVAQYNNAGQLTATGLYSSTSGLIFSSNPTTLATNRIALSKSFYDEMGRVWKTQTHKIDPADGSDDDNLQTLTWRDVAGRVTKVDGGQLSKTEYDRLGRAVAQYTLAVDNDTVYANADDVTGDIVVQETHTVYDGTAKDNLALLVYSVSRHPDDYGASQTTAALDTNADTDDLLITAANLEGRGSITCMWYDSEDRVTDTVQYGTYGGSNFDRDGLSVPARSDTALRSTTVYNDDGTVASVTDPMNVKTSYTYDDAGRRTVVIANDTGATPEITPADRDTDVYTRYEFTNGLQTKMWTDGDGDNVVDGTDQVTLYIFGTTKGATAGLSNIATGNLLRAVVYPDSTNTETTVTGIDTDDADVVSYAYNAQGQWIRVQDQLGTVMEYNYDVAGRQIHERATTTGTDVDFAKVRKTTAFDDLGRVETVTQYDNAAVESGDVEDQVKFTYALAGWGRITKFEQDHNSTVAAGGTLAYNVDYTWAKATTGRNTIRRATMDLPDGTTITYNYTNAASGSGDGDLSRVSNMVIGGTTVADYTDRYLGMGRLVGLDMPEPDVYWKATGASSGTYDDLDRFGRLIIDDWQQDLATDRTIYTVDRDFNRNSNITSAEDNIHTTTAAGGGNGRVDVLYTYDGLNRLTRAKRGHWDGSTVTDGNATGDERWTSLGQTNTAEFYNLDLDGDLNYTDANEMKDDRTFNIFNELTGRNTDDSGADEYTLSYDANGNRTDDGQSYDIILDAWNRVVEIQDRSDSSTVAEFAYNGLNHKISMHVDTDTDGDVDGSDDIEYYALTQGWQVAAMYLNTDSDPTEQFVYNNAGLDGRGGSSTINDMLLRDRDTDANTTLDERTYAIRDHIRGDVVAVIDDTGSVLEWIKYSANGEPTNYMMGDANDSGNVDTTDIIQVLNWSNASTYDARGDTDGDGDVDAADVTAVSALSGSSTGYNVLSRSDVLNDFGYTGQRHLSEVGLIDYRNRLYGAENQTFIQRDPLGFVDGVNVYAYVGMNPIRFNDPMGLAGDGLECGGGVIGVQGGGGCDGLVPGEEIFTCLGEPTYAKCITCCVRWGGELSYCRSLCRDKPLYPFPGSPLPDPVQPSPTPADDCKADTYYKEPLQYGCRSGYVQKTAWKRDPDHPGSFIRVPQCIRCLGDCGASSNYGFNCVITNARPNDEYTRHYTCKCLNVPPDYGEW